MNVIQLSRIEEGNPQSYAKYLSEHIAMNTLHGNNDFFFLKCDALNCVECFLSLCLECKKDESLFEVEPIEYILERICTNLMRGLTESEEDYTNSTSSPYRMPSHLLKLSFLHSKRNKKRTFISIWEEIQSERPTEFTFVQWLKYNAELWEAFEYVFEKITGEKWDDRV